jgi:hypothetical protein
MGLFNALLTLKEEGKTITKMVSSVELLAQANSRRGALAAALLPPLHWVLIGSLCMLLLSAFLLFDSDFSSPVGENRVIFSVLTAMIVSILQVHTSSRSALCPQCLLWQETLFLRTFCVSLTSHSAKLACLLKVSCTWYAARRSFLQHPCLCHSHTG